METATNPTDNETREPCTTRLAMSRPMSSVPKKCCAEGGRSTLVRLTSFGEYRTGGNCAQSPCLKFIAAKSLRKHSETALPIAKRRATRRNLSERGNKSHFDNSSRAVCHSR